MPLQDDFVVVEGPCVPTCTEAEASAAAGSNDATNMTGSTSSHVAAHNNTPDHAKRPPDMTIPIGDNCHEDTPALVSLSPHVHYSRAQGTQTPGCPHPQLPTEPKDLAKAELVDNMQ